MTTPQTQQKNKNNSVRHQEDKKKYQKKNGSTIKNTAEKMYRLLYKQYKFLQSKLEVTKLKEEFHARKEVPTPKYRGQLHNYGKWVSLIPSALLILNAQSKRSRMYAVLFSVGVFWMQFISSKMHCRPYQTAPEWIRKLDNISIFVYIGINWISLGSQLMSNDPQWELIKTFLKIITLTAIFIRLITLHSPRWIISGLALAMGWVSVLGLKSIIQKLNLYECSMLFMGGISITLGALCWALQIPHFKKSVWTPHETFHLGTVFMMGFFYLLMFSLQQTHPKGF